MKNIFTPIILTIGYVAINFILFYLLNSKDIFKSFCISSILYLLVNHFRDLYEKVNKK